MLFIVSMIFAFGGALLCIMTLLHRLLIKWKDDGFPKLFWVGSIMIFIGIVLLLMHMNNVFTSHLNY